MSSISWTSTASGNWNTAANWSGGAVPGAASDVTINTGTSITVTYSTGTDSVLSLYVGGNDKLDVTGGTLSVDGSLTMYGTYTQSAGVFTLAGASAYMGGPVTQTGGTIDIASGSLSLAGTDSLGGTITGAELLISGGADSVLASAKINVAELAIAGGDITLTSNFTQAGLYEQTGGTLSTGSATVTLDGPASLDAAEISGAGKLVLAGATEVSGSYLVSNVAVQNTATLEQTGFLYIGYFGTDSVTFTNTATGKWQLIGGADVYGNANTQVTNLGVLANVSGNGQFRDNLTDNGTITVSAGDLQFSGAVASFGGVVNGAGTMELASGADSFATGLKLQVGTLLLDGANVTLGGSLSYGGVLEQTAGTLALGGDTLTLSGTAELDAGFIAGTGSLVLSGTTELGNAALSGAVKATNTGTVDQTSSYYIGYYGTDTVTFTNAAGALYRLDGGNTLYGSAGSSFVNAGTFEKTAASTSIVNVSYKSTGTTAVDAGYLVFQGATSSFAGTISGAGTLALNGGADSFANKLTLKTAGVLVEGNTVLSLGGKITYTGDYAQTSGTLALGSTVFTASGAVTLDGGYTSGSGTLSVKSATVYTYALTGTTELLNTGTITVNNYLYDGYNAADAAKVVNSGVKSTILLSENAYIAGTAGSTLTNAGLIDKTSGAGVSVIQVNTSSTGTLESAQGTLRLSGATNSIAGKVIGAGWLELSAGADNFASGVSVTVSNLLLDGATVTLGGPLAYAGTLLETAGTLALGGNTLSLTGPFDLQGGFIAGTGILSTTGQSTITGGALENSVVMKNSGTILQDGSWYIGYNSSDTAQFDNLTGGLLHIEAGTIIYTGGNSVLNNAGTIDKTGVGNSTISPSLINTGTVTVAAGALYVSGSANTLGGSFNGAGMLVLNTGTDTVSAGTVLNIGNLLNSGANVTLAGAESYAGYSSQTGGTLGLGTNNLTLSGNALIAGGYINGSSKLTLSGQTQITGGAFEGSVTASNSGTITDIGNFYLGYNTSDTASLDNLAGGTFLLDDTTIYSQAGDTIVNAGLISKALGAGLATIETAVTNTGSITLTQGSLTFLGKVGGSGSITAGASTDLAFNAAVAAGGSVTLGADADLLVSTTAGFADTIAGFALGNLIDLGGLGYVTGSDSFTYNAAHDTLLIGNGTANITLQLSGSYTSGNFALFNDAGNIGIRHT